MPESNNHGGLPTLGDHFRLWEKALRVGDYNRACALELTAYNTSIKPIESLAAWNEWQDLTNFQRRRLTEYYVSAFPAGQANPNGRLAVVLHNFSGLAHEVQFGRQLKKVLFSSKKLKATVIYAFGKPANRDAAAGIYGIDPGNVFFLNSKGYLQAALALDHFASNNNLGTIVYPSTAFFCFWVSLFCRHPNQKFFQMKYFPRQVGRISEWAGCDDGGEGPNRLIRGEGFAKLPIDVSGLPVVSARREASGDILRFGSISRIEKIQDNRYVQFILGILESYPESEYLITGRPSDNSKIPAGLRDHERVRFVGWVAPEKFILNLDIYLDPWPWGGGDMSFLAMVNAIPYLTLVTDDAMVVGPLGAILSMVKKSSRAGELTRFLPSSEKALRQAFEMLAQRPEVRTGTGQAWATACREMGVDDVPLWRRFLFE